MPRFSREPGAESEPATGLWLRPGGGYRNLRGPALPVLSSLEPRVGLFPPSPSSHLTLPLQVGIQVASEDLCSEKQWNVCKALATFVAHRELSKVGACPPQRCLSCWAQATALRERLIAIQPRAPPLHTPLCKSHAKKFRQNVPHVYNDPSIPWDLAQEGNWGDIWRMDMVYQVKVGSGRWPQERRLPLTHQHPRPRWCQPQACHGRGDRPCAISRNLF